MRQAHAGMAVDRVLQARHGRLTGQIRIALGAPATDQLEQGVRAQAVRVILILVAAGNLEDALADQSREGVVDVRPSPLGDTDSEGRADAQVLLRLGQPGQPTVRGETSPIKSGFQGEGGGCGERVGGCGRLRRHGGLLCYGGASNTSTIARPTAVPQAHE
jgi:hypothetical protein